MYRFRFAVFLFLLQFALMLVVSACGGSSSTSHSKSKPTATQTSTPTTTPTPAIQAQAPINGIVAIEGGPGTAPGAGIVKGTVSGTGSAHRKAAAAASTCSATGSGVAFPDGSFALSVCASIGNQIGITYTSSSGSQTALGNVTVPQFNTLPSCPAGFRTFEISNTGNNEIWLGVNSGAQPAPASANGCGTTKAGEACAVPGTECSPLANPAQCMYVATNVGEYQACSSANPTCTNPAQTCNTSLGLCQWNLDYDYANSCSATTLSCPGTETCDLALGVCLKQLSKTIPAKDLTLTPGVTKVLCMPAEPPLQPGLTPPGQPCTQNSQCASAQCNFYPPNAAVQQCVGSGCVCGPINPFSGGMYARTGCQSDGTNCQAGDCLNAPYQPCPLGKGAGNPASQAEFTLSEFSQDFYDVTVINGANAAIQMAPAGTPAAAPTTDTPAQADYWCQTPGGTSAQSGGALPGCTWSFDTTNVNGANQTSLLAQINLPVCSQPNPTATPTPAASAAATPAQIGCPIGSTCAANGSSSYYCKPQSQACTMSSQCPGGMPCVNGYCNPNLQCASNSDCSPGAACAAGLCLGDPCNSDADCTPAAVNPVYLESATCQNAAVNPPPGQPSTASICVPLSCDTNVKCPPGFTCPMSGNGECQPTQTTCSLTQPCPSIRQNCDIPAGQMTGTCITARQCGPDGSCPPNTVCGVAGQCVAECSTDSDCKDVAGTCVGGQCVPFSGDSTTTCPTGYQQLPAPDNSCVLSCSNSSSCTNSIFGGSCGSGEFNANVIQTCGVATGAIWSMDDFCGISGKGTYGGVNCEATAQPGDTFANMFGCNGSGVGSAVSCYNNPNGYTACCGCPTFPPVKAPWSETVSSLTCSVSNSVWTGQVMPWLQYLKTGCPTAYSFPFDDATSTFECDSLGTTPPNPSASPTATGVPNVMNYNVSFGSIAIPGLPTPTPTP